MKWEQVHNKHSWKSQLIKLGNIKTYRRLKGRKFGATCNILVLYTDAMCVNWSLSLTQGNRTQESK